MLPDEEKNFTSEHSWFDFSDVTLPWPEFQGMGDDPEFCPTEFEVGWNAAFKYEGEGGKKERRVAACVGQFVVYCYVNNQLGERVTVVAAFSGCFLP